MSPAGLEKGLRVGIAGIEPLRSMVDKIVAFTQPQGSSSQRPTPSELSIDGIDPSSLTDRDTVVLTLYSRRALVGSNITGSVDHMVEWASSQGRPINRETLRKYTLPQDKTLKPWIVPKKVGNRTEYQLSKLGLSRAKSLLEQARNPPPDNGSD